MERSAPEGRDMPERTSRTPDCEPDPGQMPLAGVAADPSGKFLPGQRLGRLLETLEHDIIPTLARTHRAPDAPDAPAQADDVSPTAPTEIDRFTRMLIAMDGAPARRAIESLLHQGASRSLIYLSVLAPAARQLGRMWEEDECTFGDVTVGVGRLHRLLRELVSDADPMPDATAHGLRVLLQAAPGEQHTFGLAMVSEFFRDAGWDVSCATDGAAPDPVAAVASEWFDTIGFSVGSHTRLNWLALAIANLRRASRNPGIVVLVGGPVITLHPEYVQAVGADTSAPDGQQAPEIARELVTRRVRQG